MYHQFVRDCRRIKDIQQEKEGTFDAYSRYRTLMREEAETRERLLRTFGVLGKFSPDNISLSTKNLITRAPMSSSEIRNQLKIWEILEAYLSASDDKSTIVDFQRFLSFVEIDASPQAIESAIKAHPELFEVSASDGDRCVILKGG